HIRFIGTDDLVVPDTLLRLPVLQKHVPIVSALAQRSSVYREQSALWIRCFEADRNRQVGLRQVVSDVNQIVSPVETCRPILRGDAASRCLCGGLADGIIEILVEGIMDQ